MRPARKSNKRGGQAIVEFALVLPVFMLLLFGILEFGRAFLMAHNLANAARIGARTGTLPTTLETDVNLSVQRFLTHLGYRDGSWTTEVQVTDPNGVPRGGGLANAQYGDHVAVRVQMPFTVLSGSIIPALRARTTINGRCVFRHE